MKKEHKNRNNSTEIITKSEKRIMNYARSQERLEGQDEAVCAKNNSLVLISSTD